MKVCGHCGNPTGRDGRADWCFTCVPIMKKLFAAAWQERNPDLVRMYKRRTYAKHRKARVFRCAVYGCVRTFLRGERQGGRKFCDECARLIFRPSYSRTRKPDFPRVAA